MLVLSRKIGEVVTIGNDIKVTVVNIDRGIVRLGIEAPKSIIVHRKEIYDKIIESNKKASATGVDDFINVISDGKIAIVADAKINKEQGNKVLIKK